MEKIGKKAVKAADTLVHYVLVSLLALLFVLGCYSLWDSHQVYDRANTTQWQPYKPVEPEPISFWELQRTNPDVRAWLSVYGTSIDYPVCQNKDINKYLDTNAKGEYSLSGGLFMDPHASPAFKDYLNFVYGHHMEQGVMFGQLTEFSVEEFFNDHRYGNMFVDDVDYGLDFFCYLDADAYDTTVYKHSFSGKQEKQDYLDLLRNRARHWREEVEVSASDRLIALSTCSSSSTNGRAILVGKICGEEFKNSFLQVPNFGTGVDSDWGYLGIPWWCWIVLVVFLILVAVLVVARLRKRNNA
jgi:sortase B